MFIRYKSDPTPGKNGHFRVQRVGRSAFEPAPSPPSADGSAAEDPQGRMNV
ncbi:MAG: hypothetical protein WCI73_20580 [Phycisphaerae bacterium]